MKQTLSEKPTAAIMEADETIASTGGLTTDDQNRTQQATEIMSSRNMKALVREATMVVGS